MHPQVGAADVSYHEPKRTLESALKKEGSVKVGTGTVTGGFMKHELKCAMRSRSIDAC